VIKIKALHTKLSEIAGLYYGHPSRDLKVIGIRVPMVKQPVPIIIPCAYPIKDPCGMIGTLTHELTTPDAITVQSELHKFKEKGMKVVVMEVSSHGLCQYRVARRLL